MTKQEAEARYLAAEAVTRAAKVKLDAAEAGLKSAREVFALASVVHRDIKRASRAAWMEVVDLVFPEHAESIKRSQADSGAHRQIWTRVQAYEQALLARELERRRNECQHIDTSPLSSGYHVCNDCQEEL